MLARSSARAGLISSTPAAARLGDTCKPVVNRLDSILATCASHRSAAIQGKRGTVVIGLRLHSCGVQPRSTAPSSNNCVRPKTSAPGVPRVAYTRHLHADQSQWRQPVRSLLQRCPCKAAASLRQSRRHYRGASRGCPPAPCPPPQRQIGGVR